MAGTRTQLRHDLVDSLDGNTLRKASLDGSVDIIQAGCHVAGHTWRRLTHVVDAVVLLELKSKNEPFELAYLSALGHALF